MRFLMLAAFLLLAACGRESEAPEQAQRQKDAAQPPMPELEPPVGNAGEREESADAASTLKRYYARIETGDYDAAWAMRSGDNGEIARQRFAANFSAYESYRADVGTPSEPVAAGDWVYVEVPVMIRGAFRGGKPFASAGSVTLRRARGDGGWQVFTGEGRR